MKTTERETKRTFLVGENSYYSIEEVVDRGLCAVFYADGRQKFRIRMCDIPCFIRSIRALEVNYS
jgi:hypothetical protein